jgi:hypothetical protein
MDRTKKVYEKLNEIKTIVETEFVGEERAIIKACLSYFDELNSEVLKNGR